MSRETDPTPIQRRSIPSSPGSKETNLALDALNNLVSNVPEWLKRLDGLIVQIEQRQIELAWLAESPSPGTDGSTAAATRLIRNCGSTESLKPNEEPKSHSHDPDDDAIADPATRNPLPRAVLRKWPQTDSAVSAEGAAPKDRTGSPINVYYDSHGQDFFDELVKFVGNSRNTIRKVAGKSRNTIRNAKVAAAVAQLEAEMKMGDDDAGDGLEAESGNAPAVGTLQTPNGASAGGALAVGAGLGGAKLEVISGDVGKPSDVYNQLDNGLEYVQGMCEQAAHQCLREGDCGQEVGNIQRRLGEMKALADRELHRVGRKEPETLNPAIEETTARGKGSGER